VAANQKGISLIKASYTSSLRSHTLVAQVAANQKGISLVEELIAEFGLEVLRLY
jgi:N-methylhydantoinase B/oxoprolinase/acetone carboxylase alpha subunit